MVRDPVKVMFCGGLLLFYFDPAPKQGGDSPEDTGSLRARSMPPGRKRRPWEAGGTGTPVLGEPGWPEETCPLRLPGQGCLPLEERPGSRSRSPGAVRVPSYPWETFHQLQGQGPGKVRGLGRPF